jgi:hypothetical protein
MALLLRCLRLSDDSSVVGCDCVGRVAPDVSGDRTVCIFSNFGLFDPLHSRAQRSLEASVTADPTTKRHFCCASCDGAQRGMGVSDWCVGKESFKKMAVSLVIGVCLSAWRKSITSEKTFTKLDFWYFYWCVADQNLTAVTHNHTKTQCTAVLTSAVTSQIPFMNKGSRQQ